jgi:outer membrane usher protein FimD/PapC
MNDWDRGNLDFILNSSDADLEDFYFWASDEDLMYALQLIQLAKAELEVEEIEILEAEANEDLSQAQAVLKRFRL